MSSSIFDNQTHPIIFNVCLTFWECIERPEEPYDSRSLFDRLKEQRDKKDLEFEETHKLSRFQLNNCQLNWLWWKYYDLAFPSTENLVRGLDDDEVDFLDIVDKAKMDAERRQQIEEKNELRDFRQRVATLQENSIDQVSADTLSSPFFQRYCADMCWY